MKFIIAVVLLAAVGGVYSEPQQDNLSDEAGAEIGDAGGAKGFSDYPYIMRKLTAEAILGKTLGPKLLRSEERFEGDPSPLFLDNEGSRIGTVVQYGRGQLKYSMKALIHF